MKVFGFILILGVVEFFSPSKGTTQESVPVKVPTTNVRIEFSYDNFNLPMKVYDVPVAGKKFAKKFNVVKNKKELPFTNDLTGKVIEAKKGEVRSLAVAVENESDRPIYFFASPHETQPSENSLGNKFFCFCYGQVYKVPPKSTWYKVVSLDISKNSLGENITFRHRIVGLTPERMRKIMNQAEFDNKGRP